jgi:methionyl-tRNA synthetase
MVEKYFDGIVPDAGIGDENTQAIMSKLEALPNVFDMLMLELKLNQALMAVWEIINMANKHIEVSKPWEIAKAGNTKRLEGVIYILLRVLEYCVFLLYPFMPDASMQIAGQLGIEVDEKTIRLKDVGKIIKPGLRVKKACPIFPRIQ